MSLDVSLVNDYEMELENWTKRRDKAVREANESLKLIVPLVEEYYDDRRPEEGKELFSYNITHNLSNMAIEAGLYEFLWRPNENGFVYARDIILGLRIGLDRLKANPSHYKMFNPSNGWGDYEGLVKFVEEYLKACIENPGAKIKVWR